MAESRLLTACYRPALLGKVKSWHAIFFEDGHVKQLVEMLESDSVSCEPTMIRRALYTELESGIVEGLHRAAASRLFHDLKEDYESVEGLLHYRELNSARVADGRHRVATQGACSLARAGNPDMIIFMGLWEKIRRALPMQVDEPRSDSAAARVGCG